MQRAGEPTVGRGRPRFHRRGQSQFPIRRLAGGGHVFRLAPQPPAAVPAQPSSQHAWIPGFWTWRNSRYEWMAGHWEVPPFAGAVWQNPRWVPESGSYRFYEGCWN